jgi:hypothetical protein
MGDKRGNGQKKKGGGKRNSGIYSRSKAELGNENKGESKPKFSFYPFVLFPIVNQTG